MQNDSSFVLVINAPPDAEQAAVAAKLVEGEAGRFLVSTNKIKFLIGDYSAEKTDRDMVNRIIFGLAQAARGEGFSLVVDGSVAIQRSWWSSYADLAQKTGAKFVEVNIEAPYDLLVERFQRRVAESKAGGKKISIDKVSDLTERHDAYQAMKKSGLSTFDSSVETIDEIAERIEQLL